MHGYFNNSDDKVADIINNLLKHLTILKPDNGSAIALLDINDYRTSVKQHYCENEKHAMKYWRKHTKEFVLKMQV